MQDLDSEYNRRAAAVQNENAANRSVTVSSVNDIIRLIQAFDPANPINKKESVDITTEIDTLEKNPITNSNQQVRKSVTTRTNTLSYRSIVLEALERVKLRNEAASKSGSGTVVNGRMMVPPPVVGANGQLHVDGLIRRLLGASRIGTDIIWKLPDGSVYVYDIFSHKLYRECGE